MIGIDMEMPKSCEECKYKGAKWCYIEIWSNRGTKEVPEEGRPSWCPLIDLSGCLNFCPNCGAKMDREE